MPFHISPTRKSFPKFNTFSTPGGLKLERLTGINTLVMSSDWNMKQQILTKEIIISLLFLFFFIS